MNLGLFYDQKYLDLTYSLELKHLRLSQLTEAIVFKFFTIGKSADGGGVGKGTER